jgi:hypothetical protein
MAVDYEIALTDSMSVHECAKQLVGNLGLVWQREGVPLRLYNDGVAVTVLTADANPFGRKLALEAFGFAPTLHLSMRPVLGGPNMDLGVQTMMRIVDLLLRSTDGDVGFASEFERVLLLRRSGQLYARDDFENYLNTERLGMISLPYERKALRP